MSGWGITTMKMIFKNSPSNGWLSLSFLAIILVMALPVKVYAKIAKANTSTHAGKSTKSLPTKLSASGVRNATASASLPQTKHAATKGSVTVSGRKMTVKQNTARQVYKWDTFDIKKDHHVHFDQPKGGWAYNKVTGGKVSVLDGMLSGENVVISNGAGVLMGKNFRTDLGSLLVTTHSMAENQFMSGGKFVLSMPDHPGGIIILQGAEINVRDGGVAAFVAPWFHNSGVIQAKRGYVGVGVGRDVVVDPHGDGLLKLHVSTALEAELVAGEEMALIEHQGTVDVRDGGTVVMTAKALGKVADHVIKVEKGEFNATSARAEGGKIILSAGGSGRLTVVDAKIDASTSADNARGGSVHLLGGDVQLKGTTEVSVDGSKTHAYQLYQTDGAYYKNTGDDLSVGEILVGSNFRGQWPSSYAGTKHVADTVYIGPNVKLSGKGLGQGSGGKIIAYSKNNTKVEGFVDVSGDFGGLLEISAKRVAYPEPENLILSGRRAIQNPHGYFLLDPEYILFTRQSDVSTAQSHPDYFNIPANMSGIVIGDSDFNANYNTNWVFSASSIIKFLAYGDASVTFTAQPNLAFTFLAEGQSFTNNQGQTGTVFNTGKNVHIDMNGGSAILKSDFFNHNGQIENASSVTVNSNKQANIHGDLSATDIIINSEGTVVNTGTLNASSKLSITANDSQNGSVTLGNWSAQNLSVSTQLGDLIIADPKGANLNLTATTGNVTVGDSSKSLNLGNNNGQLNLVAGKAITLTGNAASGSQVSVGDVTMHAGTGIVLDKILPVTMSGVVNVASGNMEATSFTMLTDTGDIQINQPVSSPRMLIQAKADNANINMYSVLTATGGTVHLFSGGQINTPIASDPNQDLPGWIFADTLFVTGPQGINLPSGNSRITNLYLGTDPLTPVPLKGELVLGVSAPLTLQGNWYSDGSGAVFDMITNEHDLTIAGFMGPAPNTTGKPYITISGRNIATTGSGSISGDTVYLYASGYYTNLGQHLPGNLSLTSPNNDITNLYVPATNITANNVTIVNAGNMKISQLDAIGDVSLKSFGGNLDISNVSFSVPNITLESWGPITNTTTLNATSKLSLTSNDPQTGSVTLGNWSAQNLYVSAQFGDLSIPDPQGATLNLNAPRGSVIIGSATKPLNLGNNNGQLQILAGGDITINGNAAAGSQVSVGSINLSAGLMPDGSSKGRIIFNQVLPSSDVITASQINIASQNGGDISLNQSFKADSIKISTSSNIFAPGTLDVGNGSLSLLSGGQINPTESIEQINIPAGILGDISIPEVKQTGVVPGEIFADTLFITGPEGINLTNTNSQIANVYLGENSVTPSRMISNLSLSTSTALTLSGNWYGGGDTLFKIHNTAGNIILTGAMGIEPGGVGAPFVELLTHNGSIETSGNGYIKAGDGKFFASGAINLVSPKNNISYLTVGQTGLLPTSVDIVNSNSVTIKSILASSDVSVRSLTGTMTLSGAAQTTSGNMTFGNMTLAVNSGSEKTQDELFLEAPITVGAGKKLTLMGPNIAQNAAGIITADTLDVQSAGRAQSEVYLDKAPNKINTLTATVIGSGFTQFMFGQGDGFTAGDILVGPLQSYLSLTSKTGTLTLGGMLYADKGAVSLTANNIIATKDVGGIITNSLFASAPNGLVMPNASLTKVDNLILGAENSMPTLMKGNVVFNASSPLTLVGQFNLEAGRSLTVDTGAYDLSISGLIGSRTGLLDTVSLTARSITAFGSGAVRTTNLNAYSTNSVIFNTPMNQVTNLTVGKAGYIPSAVDFVLEGTATVKKLTSTGYIALSALNGGVVFGGDVATDTLSVYTGGNITQTAGVIETSGFANISTIGGSVSLTQENAIKTASFKLLGDVSRPLAFINTNSDTAVDVIGNFSDITVRATGNNLTIPNTLHGTGDILLEADTVMSTGSLTGRSLTVGANTVSLTGPGTSVNEVSLLGGYNPTSFTIHNTAGDLLFNRWNTTSLTDLYLKTGTHNITFGGTNPMNLRGGDLTVFATNLVGADIVGGANPKFINESNYHILNALGDSIFVITLGEGDYTLPKLQAAISQGHLMIGTDQTQEIRVGTSSGTSVFDLSAITDTLFMQADKISFHQPLKLGNGAIISLKVGDGGAINGNFAPFQGSDLKLEASTTGIFALGGSVHGNTNFSTLYLNKATKNFTLVNGANLKISRVNNASNILISNTKDVTFSGQITMDDGASLGVTGKNINEASAATHITATGSVNIVGSGSVDLSKGRHEIATLSGGGGAGFKYVGSQDLSIESGITAWTGDITIGMPGRNKITLNSSLSAPGGSIYMDAGDYVLNSQPIKAQDSVIMNINSNKTIGLGRAKKDITFTETDLRAIKAQNLIIGEDYHSAPITLGKMDLSDASYNLTISGQNMYIDGTVNLPTDKITTLKSSGSINPGKLEWRNPVLMMAGTKGCLVVDAYGNIHLRTQVPQFGSIVSQTGNIGIFQSKDVVAKKPIHAGGALILDLVPFRSDYTVTFRNGATITSNIGKPLIIGRVNNLQSPIVNIDGLDAAEFVIDDKVFTAMSNTRLLAELIGNLEGSSSARRAVDFMDTGKLQETQVHEDGDHEVMSNGLYTTVLNAEASDQQVELSGLSGALATSGA